MNVLLIGGGGLIGTNLIRHLCQNKIKLVVYSGHEPSEPVEACTYYQGDVTDYGTLNMVFKKHHIECVIHNAGVSSPKLYLDNPYKIYKTNVIGLLTSLEAARNFDVRRFIYISSAGVYSADGPQIVCEEDGRKGDIPYRASKICGEELVRNYGFESVSLRVSYVYGPGRYTACPIREMASRLCEKDSVIWKKGADQKQDYIYVDDVSEGIMKVLLAPVWPHTEYNLGSGRLESFRKIMELVKKEFPGKEIVIGPGSLGFSEKLMNIDRIKKDFDWEPRTGLEEGMRKYLKWIREDMGYK